MQAICGLPSSSRAARQVRAARTLLVRAVPRVIVSKHEDLDRARAELKQRIKDLGFPQSILPGGGEAKAKIDKLVEHLEAMSPVSHPMRTKQPERGRASPGETAAADPLLVGDWDLVYANNGTVVTRSTPAQIILAASQLPGVGLQDIQQQLKVQPDGSLVTTNQAVFGFGPFGLWRIGVDGVWRDNGDGKTVKVYFNSLSLKPVGFLGLEVPDWMPPLSIPSGTSETAGREGADWTTSYVDEDLRVGRGKSGVFIFYRRTSSGAR